MGTGGTPRDQIDHERARQILENGGSERDAYLQRFQEENPQYQIQSINVSKEEAALASKFDSISNAMKAASIATVSQYHTHNGQNVLSQGNESNLDLNKTPKSIQQEVRDFVDVKDRAIDRGQETIRAQEAKLRTTERASQDKSPASSVLNNAFASVTPDQHEVFQKLAQKDPAYQDFLMTQQQSQTDTLMAIGSSLATSQGVSGHEEKTQLPKVIKNTPPPLLSSKIRK